MGEVLKFRRPRRKVRPSLPAPTGTIILFTGVWHGHAPEFEATQRRIRRKRTKAQAEAPAAEASESTKPSSARKPRETRLPGNEPATKKPLEKEALRKKPTETKLAEKKLPARSGRSRATPRDTFRG